MSSKQLSAKSEKYFIKKFTKELIRLWQSLSIDEASLANETMNYLVFREVLGRLGFVSDK